jgi:predicted heme/steroid binding protein
LTPITVQPVFSNVGEPEHLAPLSGREPSLVVFGSPSTRRRALAALPPYAEALGRQGISEILEVGAGEATPWTAIGLKVRFLGRMEKPDLRALLERTAYGLIEYPSKYLGKSGVFAAYCAYGCVVLNVSDAADESDGLQAGVHFVNLSRSASLTNDVRAREAMALVAKAWYEGHALSRQAEAFATSCAVHPLQGADRK